MPATITRLKQLDPIAHLILVQALDMLLEEVFREGHGPYYDMEHRMAFVALCREILDDMFDIHV